MMSVTASTSVFDRVNFDKSACKPCDWIIPKDGVFADLLTLPCAPPRNLPICIFCKCATKQKTGTAFIDDGCNVHVRKGAQLHACAAHTDLLLGGAFHRLRGRPEWRTYANFVVAVFALKRESEGDHSATLFCKERYWFRELQASPTRPTLDIDDDEGSQKDPDYVPMEVPAYRQIPRVEPIEPDEVDLNQVEIADIDIINARVAFQEHESRDIESNIPNHPRPDRLAKQTSYKGLDCFFCTIRVPIPYTNNSTPLIMNLLRSCEKSRDSGSGLSGFGKFSGFSGFSGLTSIFSGLKSGPTNGPKHTRAISDIEASPDEMCVDMCVDAVPMKKRVCRRLEFDTMDVVDEKPDHSKTPDESNTKTPDDSNTKTPDESNTGA
jgi:hypothetical protein